MTIPNQGTRWKEGYRKKSLNQSLQPTVPSCVTRRESVDTVRARVIAALLQQPLLLLAPRRVLHHARPVCRGEYRHEACEKNEKRGKIAGLEERARSANYFLSAYCDRPLTLLQVYCHYSCTGRCNTRRIPRGVVLPMKINGIKLCNTIS